MSRTQGWTNTETLSRLGRLLVLAGFTTENAMTNPASVMTGLTRFVQMANDLGIRSPTEAWNTFIAAAEAGASVAEETKRPGFVPTPRDPPAEEKARLTLQDTYREEFGRGPTDEELHGAVARWRRREAEFFETREMFERRRDEALVAGQELEAQEVPSMPRLGEMAETELQDSLEGAAWRATRHRLSLLNFTRSGA